MPRPIHAAGLGVFVREGWLAPDERRRLAGIVFEREGDAAEIQTASDGFATDRDVRRVWDVPLPDDLQEQLISRVEALRPELEEAFGVRLSPCDGLSALRYPPGAFYRTHRDRADTPDEHGLHRRAVSIVVFVNGGTADGDRAFTGGCLRLYELVEDGEVTVDIEPEAGTLVAFHASLLHEVTPVEGGVRASLVTWLLDAD